MSDIKTISFYPLTAEQAQLLTPNAYNLQLAIEKGLAKKDIYDGDYLELQAAYLSVANYYLCAKAGLDGYQQVLNQHNYHFAAPETNVYMQSGAFGRKNICIRNVMYVEKLNTEDLQLLRENIYEQKIQLDDAVVEMVGQTLPQVIVLQYGDNDGVFEAVYDSGVFQTNFAPSNAMVFGLAYEMDYDEKGNLIDCTLEEEKLKFVEALADMMAAEMEEKLDIPVRVFVN